MRNAYAVGPAASQTASAKMRRTPRSCPFARQARFVTTNQQRKFLET
ncbi:unnamed protein product, partial [Amoebophrya sp. A120]|eukprot:GSA120T00013753001.1